MDGAEAVAKISEIRFSASYRVGVWFTRASRQCIRSGYGADPVRCRDIRALGLEEQPWALVIGRLSKDVWRWSDERDVRPSG